MKEQFPTPATHAATPKALATALQRKQPPPSAHVLEFVGFM
jgi:hypothetical protein